MRLFVISLIGLLVTTTGRGQNADIDLVRSINPENPSASILWKSVSGTAKPVAVAVPAGMFAVALLQQNTPLRNEAIEAAASLAISAVATAGMKQLVQRQRPYQRYSGVYPDTYDDSKSFPSGHASLAFATATSLSIQYKKWYITAPAFAWAGAVGYSRIYMGQHYPTDILASAVTGAGSAWLAHWLGKKFFTRKQPATSTARVY